MDANNNSAFLIKVYHLDSDATEIDAAKVRIYIKYKPRPDGDRFSIGLPPPNKAGGGRVRKWTMSCKGRATAKVLKQLVGAIHQKVDGGPKIHSSCQEYHLVPERKPAGGSSSIRPIDPRGALRDDGQFLDDALRGAERVGGWHCLAVRFLPTGPGPVRGSGGDIAAGALKERPAAKQDIIELLDSDGEEGGGNGGAAEEKKRDRVKEEEGAVVAAKAAKRARVKEDAAAKADGEGVVAAAARTSPVGQRPEAKRPRVKEETEEANVAEGAADDDDGNRPIRETGGAARGEHRAPPAGSTGGASAAGSAAGGIRKTGKNLRLLRNAAAARRSEPRAALSASSEADSRGGDAEGGMAAAVRALADGPGSGRSAGRDGGRVDGGDGNRATRIAAAASGSGSGAEGGARAGETPDGTEGEDGAVPAAAAAPHPPPAAPAAGPPPSDLRLWLRRMDASRVRHRGRMEGSYAAAFEDEFDSLAELARAAANTSIGVPRILEVCGVTKLGDMVCLEQAIKELPLDG